MKFVDKDDIRIFVHGTKLFFTTGYIEYEWVGDSNLVLISHENIETGRVRMIGNVMFYASVVLHGSWLKKSTIHWDLVEQFPEYNDRQEFLKSFKKNLVHLRW